MNSRIGVLGTGMMGGAFAKLYQEAGHPVAVWNRSADKCEEFRRGGATVAASIGELVGASDILFCNVTTHEILHELLEPAKAGLVGRLVVNLVTGTADDARATAALVEGAGGRYLDGAIEAYPSDVGDEATLIVYAGAKAAWQEHEALLKRAGGASRWIGEDAAAANIFDTAMAGGLGSGCLGAFVESVHYANSAGVALSEIEGCVDYFIALARREMMSVIDAISKQDFADGGAPLSIYAVALKTWQENMLSSGSPASLISAHLQAIERAVEKGNGDLHIAATYR